MRVEKLVLSESQKGYPILISSLGSPGDLIHKVPDVGNVSDTLHLWVYDYSAMAGTLEVELGSVAATYKVASVGSSPIRILEGCMLDGGTELRAYDPTGAGALFYVYGYVLRLYKD